MLTASLEFERARYPETNSTGYPPERIYSRGNQTRPRGGGRTNRSIWARFWIARFVVLLAWLLAFAGPAYSLSQRETSVVRSSPEIASEASQSRHREARQRMVKDQLIARGIVDREVLAAMGQVPRHEFVSKHLREFAYEDRPLPIAEDQTISQPYIVAIMTQLGRLDKNSRVLEIGTGSGYQAAVLQTVAGEVYSIEIIETLAKRVSKTLPRLGYGAVHLRYGDGYRGWPEAAPFDAILVTAAPPSVPKPLLEQLAVGGRLIVPVGTWAQELVVYTKTAKGIERESIFPVRFVPMTGQIQTTH